MSLKRIYGSSKVVLPRRRISLFGWTVEFIMIITCWCSDHPVEAYGSIYMFYCLVVFYIFITPGWSHMKDKIPIKNFYLVCLIKTTKKKALRYGWLGRKYSYKNRVIRPSVIHSCLWLIAYYIQQNVTAFNLLSISNFYIYFIIWILSK